MVFDWSMDVILDGFLVTEGRLLTIKLSLNDLLADTELRQLTGSWMHDKPPAPAPTIRLLRWLTLPPVRLSL